MRSNLEDGGSKLLGTLAASISDFVCTGAPPRARCPVAVYPGAIVPGYRCPDGNLPSQKDAQVTFFTPHHEF